MKLSFHQIQFQFEMSKSQMHRKVTAIFQGFFKTSKASKKIFFSPGIFHEFSARKLLGSIIWTNHVWQSQGTVFTNEHIKCVNFWLYTLKEVLFSICNMKVFQTCWVLNEINILYSDFRLFLTFLFYLSFQNEKI